MKKQIKVIHLMTSFGGGISSFILNKAEALSNESIIFDVITFGEVSSRFERAIHATGGKIHQVSDPKKLGIKKFTLEFNSILKKQPSNTIIHSHFGMNLIVPVYFIAKFNNVERFIIHAHTSAPDKFTNFKRKLNSFFAKEKVSASFLASVNVFGTEAAKYEPIVHIPNSIEPKAYLKDFNIEEEKLRVLGSKYLNKKIIGHIGRFDPIKNHNFMIQLIEEMANNKEEFLWLFIGEGESRQEIEAIVKQKKLTPFVKFLGRRDDLPELYKIMDIVVLPSFYEGLPTVAIEAQAAGTPMILSSTITQECDLDLNLLKFIDNTNKDEWLKYLHNFETPDISNDIRMKRLEEKKFTNTTSAEIYQDFLEQKIKSYNI